MGSYLLFLVETFVHLPWSFYSPPPKGHEVAHGDFYPAPGQLEVTTSEIRGKNRQHHVAYYLQQVTDDSDELSQKNRKCGLVYR
jgi:hypothetical protein